MGLAKSARFESADDFSIPVEHVSDTAWLVAGYRMAESRRPDRLFNDFLAEKLIAEKGKKLLSVFPDNLFGEWMMALRTILIDRFILEMIKENQIDTILNLAAGLDTRPYRLDFPKDKNIVWVEADLEGVIQYKNECLKEDRPVCQLRRVVVNLGNDQERRNFLREFHHSRRVLVITEGILGYLKPEEVQSLSEDLMAIPGLSGWILDIVTLAFFNHFRNVFEKFQRASEKQVQFQFVPKDELQLFKSLGWQVSKFQDYCEYSNVLGRKIPEESLKQDPDLVSELKDCGIAALTR